MCNNGIYPSIHPSIHPSISNNGICICNNGICTCNNGICMYNNGICICNNSICTCNNGICTCNNGICTCTCVWKSSKISLTIRLLSSLMIGLSHDLVNSVNNAGIYNGQTNIVKLFIHSTHLSVHLLIV